MADDSKQKHPANCDDPTQGAEEHEETSAFVRTYLELADQPAERSRKKPPKG